MGIQPRDEVVTLLTGDRGLAYLDDVVACTGKNRRPIGKLQHALIDTVIAVGTLIVHP